MSERELTEPVAYGFPNSAITGSQKWLMLREEIPPNDQYKGALWVPLYVSPQSAERDALRQVAVLREALADCREHVEVGLDTSTDKHGENYYRRKLEAIDVALTDTDAAAQAWERELRNRVLEEVAARADAQGPGIKAAQILAMKETP